MNYKLEGNINFSEELYKFICYDESVDEVDDDVCLILGDNIFYGKIIPSLLQEISSSIKDNNSSYDKSIFKFN